MASIRKLRDKWRAEVARNGVRSSKVFATKTEAKDWAARQEYQILNGDKIASAQTFGSLMKRYSEEISPSKRGQRWEQIRLDLIMRDRLAEVSIKDLTAEHIADWRDRRSEQVAPGSVLREMNLIGSVLSQARREWRLMTLNPMADVRRPKEPPPRDRRPSTHEIERMAHVAGVDLSKRTARAYHAFLFAIETAMRAGEIVGLSWDRIDLAARVARLDMTKNGTTREVPLSSTAVKLLEALPKMEPVFGLSSMQLASLFRKVTGKAAVDGLTFHDSRHEAITRLSRKLGVLELARMVGHRDIKMLMIYYNESAADLAKRLD